MELKEIYGPIQSELASVENEIRQSAYDLDASLAGEVFKYFFQSRGKLLRPALLLLSAAASDFREYNSKKPKLIKAAAAFELIHNASLIHDDVVDGDMFRRGIPTLNNVYGSRIAAIAGDALFAKAVSLLLDACPREIVKKILVMVRNMSSVEVVQLSRKDEEPSKEGYLDLIENKTALLMEMSCMVGSVLVSEDSEMVERFRCFGYNFGMTYQLVDDYIDRDPIAVKVIDSSESKGYFDSAAECLDGIAASEYKVGLRNMLDYITSKTHKDMEAITNNIGKVM